MSETPAIRRRDIGLAAGIVALFYVPLLDAGTMLSGGDFSNLFWPGKLHLQRAWEQGVIPLWNPYSYLGTPFAATMQHGVFYPVDWLIFSTASADAGLGPYVALHLVLAALGMLFWITRVTPLRGFAAAALAAAWPCTSWFWGHQEHVNQIACTAWTPWLLGIAAEFALGRRPLLKFIPTYGIVAAIQFLAGHPQAAFQTHLVTAALLAVTRGPEAMALWPRIKLRWGALAAAGALAMAISGAQLLPTYEMQKNSIRPADDPSYARSFSVPPDALALLVAPHAFGSFRDGYRRLGDKGEIPDLRAYNEYGMFAGVPILALAFLGVAAGIAQRRRAAIWLGVGALAALVLAMGGNLQPRYLFPPTNSEFPAPGWSPYDLFLALMPPARGFRVPARFLMPFLLIVVTLAAIGWSQMNAWLRQRGAKSLQIGALGLATACASILALYLPSRLEKFRFPVPRAPFEAAVAAEPKRDPSLDSRVYRFWLRDDELVAKSERELLTSLGEGNPLVTRWSRLQPNMNVAARVPMEDGYEEGLSPTLKTKDFLNWFNRNFRNLRPDAQFLALIGVASIWIDDPLHDPRAFDGEYFPPDTSESTPARQLRRNPLYRGAAFWIDQAEGVDFAAFNGPAHRGEGFKNVRHTEAVSYGTASAWDRPWPRLKTSLPTCNSVRIESPVNAPPGDAVLAMGSYPGWQLVSQRWVRKPVEWLSAVHARIPREFIEDDGALMQYQPQSYRVGLLLSAIGIAVWAFLRCARPRGTRPTALS